MLAVLIECLECDVLDERETFEGEKLVSITF